MEGYCLFHDNECGQCVRSGKANREADNCFRQRLDDHKKASYLKTQKNRNSKFYLSCPTGKIGTKCKYEWLTPCCAFGFHKNMQVAINVVNDEQHFNYESAESHLNATSLRNENVTTAKKCCFMFV